LTFGHLALIICHMALAAALHPRKTRAARSLLGLPPRRSAEAFISELRAGFPSRSLENVAKRLEIPAATLWEALQLAPRTLARRRTANSRLSQEESERVLHVALVLAFATDALGSIEKARRWLQKESRVLGDVPLRLLDTDVGTSLVLDELGRIEHGIFA
jgi:putative toxin-antitoxin system antitoxin component (TIGR02293 family)